MDNILRSSLKLIPVFGELNFELPNPGEYIHVVGFKVMDPDGYIHVGVLELTFGKFIDGSNNYGQGPVQAEVTVYQSNMPNDADLNFDLNPNVEYHKKVPML